MIDNLPGKERNEGGLFSCALLCGVGIHGGLCKTRSYMYLAVVVNEEQADLGLCCLLEELNNFGFCELRYCCAYPSNDPV